MIYYPRRIAAAIKSTSAMATAIVIFGELNVRLADSWKIL